MNKCISIAPVVVCFTAADGTRTSLLEHVLYENSVAIGQVFTSPTDTETPIDVSTGTITAGACPIFSPDIELDDFCDALTDGSMIPFLRQTVTYFDPNGLVIAPMIITDYELDGITPYTVVGTVQDDCGCEPKGSLGTVTDWTVLN